MCVVINSRMRTNSHRNQACRMSLAEVLAEICKEDELKKSTPVTETIIQSAHKMLALLEGKKSSS